MFRLFKHKEKNSLIILVVYILSFISYVTLLVSAEYSIGDANPFYFFVMMSVMPETFRHSLFNLSYYFANGEDYSINKPVISELRAHLQFLSIKMNDFVLYNIVYTILRLLPFVIVTFVLTKGTYPIYFIFVFSAAFILKAFVGPISTYINSILLNIRLNEKELSGKEKKELFHNQIKDIYPEADMKLFSIMRKVYSFSGFGLFILVYVFIFPFIFEIFKLNIDVVIIVGIIAFVLMGVCGLYFNDLERKQDYVLYKE